MTRAPAPCHGLSLVHCRLCAAAREIEPLEWVSRRVAQPFAALRSVPTLLNLFADRDRASSIPRSDFLDLGEAELDRRLAAEDLDERLDALRLGVDLGDRRVERGERAVDDHDRVGDVEVGDL